MILLDDSEILIAINKGRKANKRDRRDGKLLSVPIEYMQDKRYALKAQAKKILIKLQAIYNLPEIGMYEEKMKEFIKELEEEVK